MTRRAERDVELGGYRVPKGVTVVMDIGAVHHEPALLSDPGEFRPERWTEEFTKGLHKFAYIPFGVGARRCIGALFAEAEAMLALLRLSNAFRFRRCQMRPRLPLLLQRCAPEREV